MKQKLILIFILLLMIFTGCKPKEKNYTVEFITNCEIENITIKVGKGKIIENSPELTKEGYVFGGWYCDGEQWDILEDKVTSNLILEARWIEYIGDELQKLAIIGEGTMKLGETRTYIVNFTPEYFKDKSVMWSTTDDSVITVDQDGNVTAVGKGTAYIIVQSPVNLSINARKKIVVN